MVPVSILSVKPPKSITFTSITTPNDFQPNDPVFFEWTAIEVDTVDLLYRLETEENFTVIIEGRAASTGGYAFRFKLPDAPGENIIFRIKDNNEDTVFTDFDPILIATTVSNEHDEQFVTEFRLNQNYPNPFNPSTSISFALEKSSKIDLSIYNAMGQQVAVLVNETKSSGPHTVQWNASGFASGVYYYRITNGEQVFTRKMTLIK